MNKRMTMNNLPRQSFVLINSLRLISARLVCFCMASGVTLAHNSKHAISAKFPYSSKFVNVLGSEIHYVEDGEGDPIVLLHGIPRKHLPLRVFSLLGHRLHELTGLPRVFLNAENYRSSASGLSSLNSFSIS